MLVREKGMQLFVRNEGKNWGRDEYIVVTFLEQGKKGKKQGRVGTFMCTFSPFNYLMTYSIYPFVCI